MQQLSADAACGLEVVAPVKVDKISQVVTTSLALIFVRSLVLASTPCFASPRSRRPSRALPKVCARASLWLASFIGFRCSWVAAECPVIELSNGQKITTQLLVRTRPAPPAC